MVHYQNGGSHVNLNINPMAELEQRGVIAPQDGVNDQVRFSAVRAAQQVTYLCHGAVIGDLQQILVPSLETFSK